MLGERLARAGIAAVCGSTLVALCAAPSHAALPSVSSGQAPGPPILYADAPDAPQLQASGPFDAAPLLVSGTDAYRGRRVPLPGLPLRRSRSRHRPRPRLAPGQHRLPELLAHGRRRPVPDRPGVLCRTRRTWSSSASRTTATDVVYRVTLNTVVADDTAVVGIGIDRDLGGGAQVPWPNGAGRLLARARRLHHGLGHGRRADHLPGRRLGRFPRGSVSMDMTRKQMTISVPRTRSLDPGAATWRYFTGTGLWDSARGRVEHAVHGDHPRPRRARLGVGRWAPPRSSTSASASTSRASSSPGPLRRSPTRRRPAPATGTRTSRPTSSRPPGARPPRPASRADRTSTRTSTSRSSPSSADEPIHAPRRDPGAHLPLVPRRRAGRAGDVPRVPRPAPALPAPRPGGPRHLPARPPSPSRCTRSAATTTSSGSSLPTSSSSSGTSAATSSPRRSPTGPTAGTRTRARPTSSRSGPTSTATSTSIRAGPTPAATRWAATAATSSGSQYPDLWAKAFTTVGPPGEGIWVPPGDPTSGPETLTTDLLGNVRWVPFLNWVGSSDELGADHRPGRPAAALRRARAAQQAARSSRPPTTSCSRSSTSGRRPGTSSETPRRPPTRAASTTASSRPRTAPPRAGPRPRLLGLGAAGARHLRRRRGDRRHLRPQPRPRRGRPDDPEHAGRRGRRRAAALLRPERHRVDRHSVGAGRERPRGDPGEPGRGRDRRRPRTARREPSASGRDRDRRRLRASRAARAPRRRHRGQGRARRRAARARGRAQRHRCHLRPARRRDPHLPDPPAGGPGRRAGTNPDAGTSPVAPPGSASGAAPRCKGQMATIVGTTGRDRIRGTSGDDVIAGRGGRDRISGRGGDDVICGNTGRRPPLGRRRGRQLLRRRRPRRRCAQLRARPQPRPARRR